MAQDDEFAVGRRQVGDLAGERPRELPVLEVAERVDALVGLQPWIRALPLTALNDALRSLMVEGSTLASLGVPLLVLALWGALSFAVALRVFRWS